MPGILQHESDWMNGGGKKESKEGKDGKALDDLIDLLNFIHAKLSVYGADPVLLGTVSAFVVVLVLLFSEWHCIDSDS